MKEGGKECFISEYLCQRKLCVYIYLNVNRFWKEKEDSVKFEGLQDGFKRFVFRMILYACTKLFPRGNLCSQLSELINSTLRFSKIVLSSLFFEEPDGDGWFFFSFEEKGRKKREEEEAAKCNISASLSIFMCVDVIARAVWV